MASFGQPSAVWKSGSLTLVCALLQIRFLPVASMVEVFKHGKMQTLGRRSTHRWLPGVVALALAGLILTPAITVLVLALTPSDSVWPQLFATVLPRYLTNTLLLMISVGAIAGLVGTIAAWLVTMYEFPFRRLLSWALYLPLAVPAYIGAYSLVDFFEYAGVFQSNLRNLFGWDNANDYFFPEIRSLGGAAIVLAAALYPYVYLLVRAAIREQSELPQSVAKTLGAGPAERFYRVGISLTRPSIMAGVAIVMMETASDFGVVDYFAVQTLTTGIFSIWLDSRNVGGAAQLALTVLTLMGVLVAVERINRRRMRFTRLSGTPIDAARDKLTGASAVAAALFCFFPFAVGFALPVGVVFSHSFGGLTHWLDEKLFQALINTLLTGGAAALISMFVAIIMVYSSQISNLTLPKVLTPFSTLGYAIPGAVIGLGLLLPLAWVDHFVADSVAAVAEVDPGLILTGTAFAVIVAYCVRFFAVAHGAAESAMERVSPSLRGVARSLGNSPITALRRVYFPLIRGSLLTGCVLVFVDCVKELPATLLLRPFNFNTLATRVYERASLENLSEAAPAALLVTIVGATGVLLLARINRN